MLVTTNIHVLRSLFLYGALAFGIVINVASPSFAAVMPEYEVADRVSAGPDAPNAIALDRHGYLYVVESSGHRLDVYDTNGVLIKTLKGLNSPRTVAVDAKGRLYVGNQGNVEIYSASTLKPLGKLGSSNEAFVKPTAITIDSHDRIYVADAKARVVKVFNPTGSLAFSFGRPGTGAGELQHPISILVDKANNEILVLDFSETAGRIQIFDAIGNFKRQFVVIGAGGKALMRPIGLVMDERNRLYVSDAYSSQVAVYDRTGVYLGGVTNKDKPLRNPLGMAYSATYGRLYVASINSARIAAFDIFDNGMGLDQSQDVSNQDDGNYGGEPPPPSETVSLKQIDCGANDVCMASAAGNEASADALYTLNAIPGNHGMIEPSGEIQAAAGTDVGFDIVPDKGFRIADVRIDSESVGILPNYAFKNIRADHLIEVEFAPLFEAGQVQAGDDWMHVSFSVPFADPVVVAKLASHHDPDPAIVRMRNLDQAGFEVRLQEWDYLDGDHAKEELSYLVMERGAHELADGTRLEAGHFESADPLIHQRVTFTQAFTVNPVVLTAVLSTNEVDAVTGRIRNLGPDGFDYRLQEQELNRKRHARERIGYIAWPPSTGTLNGLLYEVANANALIGHRSQKLAVHSGFLHTPALLAGMQTFNGSDPANLRLSDVGLSGMSLWVDEEQSKDGETWHVGEMAGYLAFGVSLEDAGVDSDSDGIMDSDEINLYGTKPLAKDSDDDGLGDGEERDYWGSTWSLDYDGDGLINLLDQDADNDGYPDGGEHELGTDPADTKSTP